MSQSRLIELSYYDEAKDLPVSLRICAVSNHEGFGDDPAVLPHFEISSVHRKKRIVSLQRSGSKLIYGFVQIFADLRHRRFGERGAAERFHDPRNLPGGHAVDDHFRHAGNKCRLAARVVFEDKRLEWDIPVPWNV